MKLFKKLFPQLFKEKCDHQWEIKFQEKELTTMGEILERLSKGSLNSHLLSQPRMIQLTTLQCSKCTEVKILREPF